MLFFPVSFCLSRVNTCAHGWLFEQALAYLLSESLGFTTRYCICVIFFGVLTYITSSAHIIRTSQAFVLMNTDTAFVST